MNEDDTHAWSPLMLAICILLVAIGYAAGALHGRAIRWALGPDDRLPPETPRENERAARRNRADLRAVLPAREQGVRMVDTRPLVFRDHPPRLERLSEPPGFLPDVQAFDEEHTR